MKFTAGTRRRAKEYEKALVQQWKENKTFEKSVQQRPEDNAYVFYDGPPFITGVPHHGTLLSSIAKDVVPRYWTMKGKRVERVWGWDCHGLPAEVFTEKKLGIKGKQAVLDYGLENYIIACRENMTQTGSLWEDTIDRIGRWVDFKGAYKTMDNEYMESVWWAFKKLYEMGKIYEGEKVLMYCTQDATPLSKAEVTMDAGAYQDVTDPSVFVKFKLVGEANTYLLAWTTTPWTLPSNMALAINQDFTYAVAKLEDGQQFIVAEDLVEKVLTDEKHQPIEFTIERTLKGKELIGKKYEPLFEDRGDKAHHIWHAEYVSTESGSGVVHISPAYGEEDFALAKEKGFPVVSNIDDNGFYTSGEWEGQNVWEANKPIAKTLHERGVVWKIEYYRHSYPHCHRCGTRLMYRAHPSWFMNIAEQRELMLEENSEHINWFPEHIKHGRFEKTVQTAPDWNLSRDRFWATPMPIWKGIDAHGKEHIKVLGSFAELKKLSGVELEDYHRPWIDEVTFTFEGVEYRRIDKVMDCWFESGSMPFAQFHYPFENVEKFEQNFPGDFIVEYVGQVRAWFYYVHAVNVGLFGRNAFKNVIVTGNIAGNDGRKMSKSYGNFTDPNELMDEYSADSLRFLLLSSPLFNGEDFALQDKDVGDVARKLGMAWNMYDFFTMYAEVDGWEWDGQLEDPSLELSNPLDQWIVSRVHQLNREVDASMQRYDLSSATKPMLEFIEDASNWYVRRSRKRFWKSDNDNDKNDAYRTLHYVLVHLSQIMAPFTPFLAEELYQKLTGGESVHLLDWPHAGHVNELLVDEMYYIRSMISLGLNGRAKEGIKVRQPLQGPIVKTKKEISHQSLKNTLEEELNVKAATYLIAPSEPYGITMNFTITPELKREGLAREVIRHVQNARKQAGLSVDDRIWLRLETQNKELSKAITEHLEVVKAEALVRHYGEFKATFDATVLIEGSELLVSLKKA